MRTAKNYTENGGDMTVVGGSIRIPGTAEVDGDIDITGDLKLDGETVTATADELNLLSTIAAGGALLQAAEADIAFGDNGVPLVTLPDGAVIVDVSILVTTAFTTGATYSVGSATDDNSIVSALSLGTTAGLISASPPAATVSEWAGVTDGALLGKTAGTEIIAGAGKIRILYFV